MEDIQTHLNSNKWDCISVRLNIESERLGWYSPVDQLIRQSRVWRIYKEAEDLFRLGQTQTAQEFAISLIHPPI